MRGAQEAHPQAAFLDIAGWHYFAYFFAPATQTTAPSVAISIVQLTLSWSNSAASPSPKKGWNN